MPLISIKTTGRFRAPKRVEYPFALRRRACRAPRGKSMQVKWLEAVAFMRSRKGASIWIADDHSRPPNWRALPSEDSLATAPATEVRNG